MKVCDGGKGHILGHVILTFFLFYASILNMVANIKLLNLYQFSRISNCILIASLSDCPDHDDDSATHGGSGQSSPGTVSTPSVRKAAPKAPKRAREAAAKGKVVIPDGSRLEPGSNMTILQAVDDRRGMCIG